MADNLPWCMVFCAFSLIYTSLGHKYGAGKCDKITPVENFDETRVLGIWFVHRGFSTSSSCLTFNYTRNASGQLQVMETKELRALDLVGVDHKYSTVGTMFNAGLAGSYRVDFTTNPLDAKYVFIATDYDSYAGVYHCQHLSGILHRRSVYVLSRQEEINDVAVEQVRRRMLVFDLEPANLEEISHDGCTRQSESDINIRFH